MYITDNTFNYTEYIYNTHVHADHLRTSLAYHLLPTVVRASRRRAFQRPEAEFSYFVGWQAGRWGKKPISSYDH